MPIPLRDLTGARGRPTLGVVIRFKNSASTLPGVLEALRRQTVRPDLILGVNNQSADASPEMLKSVGARVLEWKQPYHHSRVLNLALSQCPTDLVLVLSSHTVLDSTDSLERLAGAMADSRTACVSCKWDADSFYTDAIDWAELTTKGLKFGSIYSNSMGMLRRSLWQQTPFDESLPTMEDGAWALEQVQRGYLCRRLKLDFRYQRGTTDRTFVFAALTFKLAARHGLFVTWLGPSASLKSLVRYLAARTFRSTSQAERSEALVHLERLRAWLIGRWQRKLAE